MANQKPTPNNKNTNSLNTAVTPQILEPVLIQGNTAPFSTKSITILILSIINLIMFPLIPGIIALVMVKNAITEIDKSKGTLKGKEIIRVGQIIAIVSLSLQALGLLIGIIFAIVGLVIAAASLIAIA